MNKPQLIKVTVKNNQQVATARAVFDELADWRERFSNESD